MKTANLAIMFTDIQGYTEKTSASSREEARDLLSKHANLLMPIIRHFRGRLVKTIGDAFLVVFYSPTAAVLCGTTIQDALYRYNSDKDSQNHINIRVAINVGEVILSRGDVYGEAVNIASRVENITPAQEVYLTESVYLSMNKTEIRTERIGEFNLKGIPEPVTVYCAPHNKITQTEDDVSGAGNIQRRLTAPALLTMPYGGKHLAEVDSEIITPRRLKVLLISALILLVAAISTFIVPRVRNNYQWSQVESAIGRGQIERAQSLLNQIPNRVETDTSRRFILQVEIATRLLERHESERSALILADLKPQDLSDKTMVFRLQLRALEQFIEAGQLDTALHTISSIATYSDTEKRALIDMHIVLAEALLKIGRFEELKSEVEFLQTVAPGNAKTHLLAGHLHMALSQREQTFQEIKTAFIHYEKALQTELALASNELLLDNVAHSYEELQENEKQQVIIITQAASLIDKYLGAKAIDPLISQLENGNNNKLARRALTAQIAKLGASSDVDNIKLAIEDLEGITCNTATNRRHAMRLIDRLRETGTADVRPLGALLKFAAKQNGCQAYALQAIQRLIGKDIGFMAKSDLTLAPVLEELSNANCQRLKNRQRAKAILDNMKRIGDLRTVGPILAFAQKSPKCAEQAINTASAILGTKVQFQESSAENQ